MRDDIQMELNFIQEPWELCSAYPKELTWASLPTAAKWLFILKADGDIYISTYVEPPVWGSTSFKRNNHRSKGSYQQIATMPSCSNVEESLLAVPQK